MESPRSPKRRRILSSINPPGPNAEDDAPRRHRSDRTMTPPDIAPDAAVPRGGNQEDAPEPREGEQGEQEGPRDHSATAPKPTKFRFKSKSSRSSRHRREERHREGKEDSDRHDHDHDRRHRRRHRSRSRSRDRDRDKDGAQAKDRTQSRDRTRDRSPSEPKPRRRRHHRTHRSHRSRSPAHAPQEEEPLPDGPPPLSPTTAFRESLFDALADDEGAAYWQSVYGQPIHIYDPPGGTGEGTGASPLDRMTDDEYAAYVRQKMWEKTHAGLLEAQERRRVEREREREKREEGERVAREMERCLRRGEERRERRGWRVKWEGYLARWRGWDAQQQGGGVEGIPWPWEGGIEGKRDGEEVRAFFVKGIGLEEVGEREFAARLKEERVRWHPDKVQQRLGGKVEEAVMREVTAVFQVVDALWNDTRRNMGG